MAVVKVEAIYAGGTYILSHDNQNGLYTAEIEALKRRLHTDQKYTYYPIMLRIIDDAGNVSLRTITDAEIGNNLLLTVREVNVFPLTFIIATNTGIECGYLGNEFSIDMDLGDTNDFTMTIKAEDWTPELCNWGYRVFIPGTEYGGLIEDRSTSEREGTIVWGGNTWRGLLGKKIIEPPDGQDNLTATGDAHKIMSSVLGNRYGSLFVVDEKDSGIEIRSYKFERYTTLLNGFEKMLASVGARLKIYYKQGDGLETGIVYLSAVKSTDWSDELEYSQDGNVSFSTRDYRCGINHLICAGEGEGTERLIIHLYAQKDGSVGNSQYYFGLDERTALYPYTSANNAETLRNDGIKKLKELINYQQFSIDVDNVDVEIGDVVGGRDHITGMEAKLPVIGKILRTDTGTTTVEYKIKGDE